MNNTVPSLLSKESNEFYRTLLDEIIKNDKSTHYEKSVTNNTPYQNWAKSANDHQRVEFLVFCIEKIRGIDRQNTLFTKKSHTHLNNYNSMQVCVATAIMRKAITLSEDDVVLILHAMFADNGLTKDEYDFYPLNYFLKHLEKQYMDKLSPRLAGEISTALQNFDDFAKVKGSWWYHDKDRLKQVARFKALLGGSDTAEFANDDKFARFANPMLSALPNTTQAIWYKILNLTSTATASKPSQKYLNDIKKLIDELGEDDFEQMVQTWFDWLVHHKDSTEMVQQHSYDYFDKVNVITGINTTIIKGLAWACVWTNNKATILALSSLAVRGYEKIKGFGASYPSVSNACIYALYRTDHPQGIAQLSRLLTKIKQTNAQKLITSYLDDIATSQGVSRDDLEDMAVDDFGLVDGKLTVKFNDYTCTLRIIGVGKTELSWQKPDGTPQKSIPSIVKEHHANALKELKATQKLINTTLTAQKDRLDRLLRSERQVSLEHAKRYYFHHGLMSYLTCPLIWTFYDKDNRTQSALCHDGVWIDEMGQMVDISAYERVGLFHPALSTTDSVRHWRSLLMDKLIFQPIKQAYREIYLLTDAEINTRTYSNRFASHILKQHQYLNLAKGRGWYGQLAGAWDGGYDDVTVSIKLPEYELTAEFWTYPVDSNDAFNNIGIWDYVSTDQVRFLDKNGEPINLVDVPARIFSEILRDVDLFVGVSSVGNDPTWADNGGLPNHRSYWQSYSFGDLSEIAKNRKQTLELLLPRLAVGKVAHIDDKFVVVQGKLRTYKIHIGSTNILMTPNDQYLCIVPDRSKKDVAKNVFIPFEGDAGLSTIISKALLLMNDDKITDPTIISQIKR